MDKNFTRSFLQAFKKIFLVTLIVFTVNSLQSFTGIDSGFTAQVKIVKCYPNPAVSFVNFEFVSGASSTNYSLQVYSFTGKKMYDAAVSNSKITINLTNDYYRGIYVYQLRDNKTGKILETGKFQVEK